MRRQIFRRRQEFTLTKEFFDDLEETNMREHMTNLDRAFQNETPARTQLLPVLSPSMELSIGLSK